MFVKTIIVISLIAIVKSEGYYCPYQDLGANGDNDLLYDYYETNSGYWSRIGQTGWQTLESYCEAKGDLSQHSDAGEWKCNDSFQLCTWNGNSCAANRSRRPDCKKLCQAILDNKGPECLGNCPNGGSDDNMHMEYCGWSIPKYSDSLTETQVAEQSNEITTTVETQVSSETTTIETQVIETQVIETQVIETQVIETQVIETEITETQVVETQVEQSTTTSETSSRVVRNRRCFVRKRR
jgi:hypothetical protein